MSGGTKPKIRSIALSTTLVIATLGVTLVPAASSEGDPEYCATHSDPRCMPDYCQQNPADPWCKDPALYCERNPDDPICRKHPQPVKKETCQWSINGVSSSPLVRARFGAQLVTIDCPNHIMSGWACSYKNPSAGPGSDILPPDVDCQYLGERRDPFDPCRSSWSWEVMLPNLNTYTVSLKTWMWKDENCDGKPDDWNTGDGKNCWLPNEYSPKTGYPWYPYSPQPDGVINACDCQMYEMQWRQFH